MTAGLFGARISPIDLIPLSGLAGSVGSVLTGLGVQFLLVQVKINGRLSNTYFAPGTA